jgi:hypothetical protein
MSAPPAGKTAQKRRGEIAQKMQIVVTSAL